MENLIKCFLFFSLTKKKVLRCRSELSDGDRAVLYGWPDKTVESVQKRRKLRVKND